MGMFTGQVALVTGSTRGIGRAIVRSLADQGADIAVHGHAAEGPSKENAEAVCAELEALGVRTTHVAGDISSKAAVGAAFDAFETVFGRLDVLVLNAARAPFKESHRLLERDLRQLVDTNLLGNVFLVQRARQLLERSGGRIVFLSSLGSRFMNPRYPLGPIKAAMESMCRQWAEELGPKGIRANAVCAGLLKTDAWKTLRRLWPGLEDLPERLFVTPEEVADAVRFLAGPESRAITGQTIVVDRGLSNRIFREPE